MGPTPPLDAAPASSASPLSVFDCSGALAASVLESQRVQWAALLAWQAALADWQNELWDEWICRWGGGAPFDA